MVKVLVVGQTPPPYVGQAIMLEMLVRSKMPGIELVHVQPALSADPGAVASFRWSKLICLFSTIVRIYYARFAHGVKILYYPPAGPNRITMFRDFAILLSTRFLFRKTIFHFHASGLCELYERLPGWQRWFFRRAYFRADAAIRVSELNPEDGKQLRAQSEYVVPNGIEDPCPGLPARSATLPADATRPLRVLFAAMLRESKGLLVAIEACARLAARGVPVHLDVMGEFQSQEFEARVRARVAHLNIGPQIRFLGVLAGKEKFAAFAQSDVFCMPTFYESESFGIVFLEAMAYGMPVVATRWRGIPSVVEEGHTAYLVETHDVEAVADRLERLAEDPQLRKRMGAAGRQRFLSEFTLPRHLERMRQVFLEVADPSRRPEPAAPSDYKYFELERNGAATIV